MKTSLLVILSGAKPPHFPWSLLLLTAIHYHYHTVPKEPNDRHQHSHLRRRAPPAYQRGHRPDHPQAVPQAHRAHRLRRLSLLRLASHPGWRAGRPARSRLRPQRPALQGRADSHRRQELRLRQLSREHAAWALTDYGFLAVIAPSFADIFFSNAGKNGMVLVRLPEVRRRTPHRAQHRQSHAPNSPSTSKPKPSPTTKASAHTSTSTHSASTACSKASTTSASPCATPPPSTPSNQPITPNSGSHQGPQMSNNAKYANTVSSASQGAITS